MPLVFPFSKDHCCFAPSITRRLLTQAFDDLAKEAATKPGITKATANPVKRQRVRTIKILNFPGNGTLRLAINSQPERARPMAIKVKTEAKRKFRSVSVPKLNNPNNARQPVKKAAMKQTKPTSIFRIPI